MERVPCCHGPHDSSFPCLAYVIHPAFFALSPTGNPRLPPVTVAATGQTWGRSCGEDLARPFKRARHFSGGLRKVGNTKDDILDRTKAVNKCAKAEFIRPLLAEQTFHGGDTCIETRRSTAVSTCRKI